MTFAAFVIPAYKKVCCAMHRECRRPTTVASEQALHAMMRWSIVLTRIGLRVMGGTCGCLNYIAHGLNGFLFDTREEGLP
jgi:hypothetical protein